MANLTLSVDENTLKKARRVAAGMGTSVNKLVRRYLSQLAGELSPEELCREFRELSFEHEARSAGWKFDRNEIHER